MANLDELGNVSAKYNMETKDASTGITTVWFSVHITGYEWTNIYVGMSKTGEWLSGSHTFFDLDTSVRDHTLRIVRTILHKMS